MAKKFSKKLYNSVKWRDIRKYVLNRDFYMCQVCNEPNCNTVHHITELTPININDPNITLNADNLITLCEECHRCVHGDYTHSKEEARYSFDVDGNIIPATEAQQPKQYTDEQQSHIKRLQARLKG
jgi:5-methylcytosine-specific restriction endonuclease McrA